MTVHRTPTGEWADCSDFACDLKFHVPDMSVAEIEAIPLRSLLPLLEAVDPHSHRGSLPGMRIWRNTEGYIHRDYDLPAIVWASGSMQWYRDGAKHRGNGRPACVRVHGEVQYWIDGIEVTETGEKVEKPYWYWKREREITKLVVLPEEWAARGRAT